MWFVPTYFSEFPVFYVTADIVVLTVLDRRLCVLLVRRGTEPFAGEWALPGGFVGPDEDVIDAAYRELAEEAGLGRDDVLLEQLETFGAPRRDPRHRVVSVAHLAMGAQLRDPRAGSDAALAEFVPVEDAAGLALAFDHSRILDVAVERARAKLEYTGLAAAFCADEFTIAELREIYEIIWGDHLDAANFHRKMARDGGFLTPTSASTTRAGGRPAALYTGDEKAWLATPFRRRGPVLRG